MNTRPFGKTGFQFPELGLGCWALGGGAYGPVAAEAAEATFARASSEGIVLWDTADAYGFGESERRIGDFLRRQKSQVFIATKGGIRFDSGPVRKDFSGGYLTQALERSLERLGCDVGLYQLHGPRREDCDRGECLQFLEEAKRSGRIRLAGVSLHEPLDAVMWLERPEIDAIQLPYSLLDRRLEVVLPEFKRTGKALILREVFGSGFLFGRYGAGHVFPKDDHRRQLSVETREDIEKRLLKLRRLCPQPGELAREAVRFVLSPPEVSVVLLGVRNEEQLAKDLGYGE